MSDQQTLIQFAGGLDLQSDPLTAPRGTLRHCQNFEVTTEAGYTKSGGWLPADGSLIGPEVPDFLYFEFKASEKTGTFIVNELVTLNLNASDGPRTITATYLGTGTPTAFLFAYNATEFADSLDAANSGEVIDVLGSLSGATIVIATSPGTVFQCGATEWDTPDQTGVGQPSTANYKSYSQAIVDAYLSIVRPVPGNPLSPVDAVCYYKDSYYAWRDLHALYFNTGTYTGAILEGMQLSKNGITSFGTILKFVVTSGTFSGGDAAGYVVFYDASDSIIATLAAGTQIKIMDALGANIGNVWKHDATDPRPLLQFTRALMYSAAEEQPNSSAPTDSWQRRRLCREISYKQTGASTGAGFGPSGDADFSIYEYSRLGTTSALAALSPVTTAYKFPNTVTQQSTAWANPNNIKAEDGAVASVAYPLIVTPAASSWIQGVEFDFSDIPAGSSIVGIEVVVKRRNTTAGEKFVDKTVQLVLPGGTFSANKANSALVYPNVLTDAIYGGTTDTWGISATPTLLNDASFGVRFEAVETVSAGATVLEVDDIKMRVTYVPATRAVYIRNASAAVPVDIPAGVIHYTVEGGRPVDNDTVGTLTIQIGSDEDEYKGTDGGKLLTYGRVIGSGEEIRTQPGGAGTLLGYTTSSDIPTTFPPTAVQNANNRARYEFKLANFYADPDAQMLWGVNGSEFGFMWDGQYSVRVRTGRRTDLDKPRHLVPHLGYMFWGFDSGDIINSATFRPVTCDTSQGTYLRNVGEPIMGLATFNGQTLGVLTDKTTRAYQGSDPGTFSPLIITPEVNCFEYTLTNLAGTPMWVSCRGIESVSSVQAYGDFVTKPISFLATPWLQPRLQSNKRFGVVDQRPSYAYAVRNKRQFRVPFRDGYQYTQTLFGSENRPMGTVQTHGRVHGDSLVQDILEFENRAPIRQAFAGLRSDGSEVIIACFENQHDRPQLVQTPNGVYPYVVKLDSSNTYGGEPFPGHMELNPIYTGFPTQPGKQQFAVVYAAAQAGEVFEMTVVSGENHYDTSTNVQGITRSVTIAPSLTATYIPQVQYSTKVDIGNAGECIRVTFSQDDPAAEAATNSMPMRFTQMVITTSPQGLPRT